MQLKILSERLRFRPGTPIHPKRLLPEIEGRRIRQREAWLAVQAHITNGDYIFEDRLCPLCGSSKLRIIADVDRFGFHFHTAICRDCGFVHANPIARPENYEHFYANYFRPLYNARIGMPSLATLSRKMRKNRETIDHFRSIGPLDEFKASGRTRVLDVGCGGGNFVWAWKEAGYDPIGIDLNEAYMDIGRQLGLDLRVGTASNLPQEAFDVVLYHHVLEHIPDPLAELKQIRKVIARGGLLLIAVPGLLNVRRRYHGDLRDYLQFAHLSHFSKETLVAFARKAGFETVYADQRCFAVFRKSDFDGIPVGPAEKDHFRRVMRFLIRTEAACPVDVTPEEIARRKGR